MDHVLGPWREGQQIATSFDSTRRPYMTLKQHRRKLMVNVSLTPAHPDASLASSLAFRERSSNSGQVSDYTKQEKHKCVTRPRTLVADFNVDEDGVEWLEYAHTSHRHPNGCTRLQRDSLVQEVAQSIHAP